MGFYSQVQITAEQNAFGMFKDTLDKHELKYEVSGTDNSRVIKIDWVKWYPHFDEVKAVEEVMHRLNEIYEEDYGYKMIVLNEDNTYERYCNERGDEHFYDMEVQCCIFNPYDV
ncbi:MAG: hypothetical protein J6P28_03560 [Treponema sp.]|nr:hypothetical protein [Treponema sp.]